MLNGHVALAPAPAAMQTDSMASNIAAAVRNTHTMCTTTGHACQTSAPEFFQVVCEFHMSCVHPLVSTVLVAVHSLLMLLIGLLRVTGLTSDWS